MLNLQHTINPHMDKSFKTIQTHAKKKKTFYLRCPLAAVSVCGPGRCESVRRHISAGPGPWKPQSVRSRTTSSRAEVLCCVCVYVCEYSLGIWGRANISVLVHFSFKRFPFVLTLLFTHTVPTVPVGILLEYQSWIHKLQVLNLKTKKIYVVI